MRRSYSGNAPATTLNGGISAAALSIVVTSGTGFPAGGGAGPFFIVIDRGLAAEEKVLCDSISGATITVNASGRGADGTPAATHASGAVVEHCFTKTDADEANAHVNDTTTDVHPQYTTTAELATHAAAADPHTAYLTSAEVTALIAAAAVAVVPVGGMTPYAGAAAPTNWLLCDGAAVSTTTYAALFAVTGHTYNGGVDPGGGNFKLPDLRQKFPMGKAASGTGATLGGTGGSKDAIIPNHDHTLANHTHTMKNHSHGLSNHSHDLSNHSHAGTTSTDGGHSHTPTGGAVQFAASHSAAGNGLASSPAEKATFSDMSTNGSHPHTFTSAGPSNNGSGAPSNNTSNAPSDNTSDTPSTNTSGAASGGVAVTDANLPSYQVFNYIIRAL